MNSIIDQHWVFSKSEHFHVEYIAKLFIQANMVFCINVDNS